LRTAAITVTGHGWAPIEFDGKQTISSPTPSTHAAGKIQNALEVFGKAVIVRQAKLALSSR